MSKTIGRSLRAVIYARVSQDPKQQLRSVSQQKDECTAECERRGWTIVRVFEDNDRSASRYATKERPEYERLIKFLKAGNADVLVTWESSRAQRDLEAYVKLRTVAESNGVQWSYKGRLYDLTRTDDRFTTGLDALLDERESSVTRDRILRDKRANAVKGRPAGQLLYGYRREYDPKSGAFVRQVPDEGQAPYVREVFRRFAAGESLFTVVQTLNARGMRTNKGNLWSTNTIKKMLSNPSYLGLRAHQGQVIGKAVWPPIVDEGMYYTCAQRLKAQKYGRTRPGKAKHLLSNPVMKCGACGGRVSSVSTRFSGRNGKPYELQRYKCNGDMSTNRGGCASMSQTRVDGHVEGLVIERLARPDAAELLGDERQAEEARQAFAEAAEKRVRLEEFYEAAANGDVTPAALARIERKLLPEIEAAEQRAADLQVPAALRDVVRPDIADFWPTLPMERRRDVIRTLMDIRLMPEGKNSKGARNNPERRVSITWKRNL